MLFCVFEHAVEPGDAEHLGLELGLFLLLLLLQFLLTGLQSLYYLFELDVTVGLNQFQRVPVLFFYERGLLQKAVHHLTDLVGQEREGPAEEIQIIWELKGLLDVLVLLNVHFVVLYQDHRALVFERSAVVWRREHRNY